MAFSVKPVLTGERTVLRPFTEADAARMGEIVGDPEVRRFTGSPGHELTPELLRSWYGSRSAQPDRLDLAVTDPADGEVLGEVVLHAWVPEERSCTFRTLIGARGRGRGIGTEATRLIVGYAFEELGLHRVQLDAYAFNDRALRVYEKVGFVREGVRREVERRDGVWVDEVLMAVLDHEWAAHRGHPGGRAGRPAAGVRAR
ncbi:N-acetyltransferase [Streptomyces sp. WAC04189]|uniref:GNAT family N-acetyltransferase n=1 Tax=Streptomyces TaxID=1883 RepID=UPI0007833053|nr:MULTISPECIES: GNAT family protein [Streptomyces]KYK09463.1 acetyltransferase [Streptomyces sp. CC71]PVD11223.1 N-acetyltransferase [Streptomyces sp. CS207]RSR98133.1 N-acetyltransferase [Streptomyces sp. WAC04189]